MNENKLEGLDDESAASNIQGISIRKSRMHIPFFIEKVKERRPDGSMVYLEESQALHQNRQILTNMHNQEDISKIHMILASKHLLYMVSCLPLPSANFFSTIITMI